MRQQVPNVADVNTIIDSEASYIEDCDHMILRKGQDERAIDEVVQFAKSFPAHQKNVHHFCPTFNNPFLSHKHTLMIMKQTKINGPTRRSLLRKTEQLKTKVRDELRRRNDMTLSVKG